MSETSALMDATRVGGTTAAALAADRKESARITRVVRVAADLAFRARVQRALERLLEKTSSADLTTRLSSAGIDFARWEALQSSTRAAASPAEFRSFARALHVSPRWLAIGFGQPAARWQEPPAGWQVFGSHVDHGTSVRLEFSEEVGDDGMPLWERERQVVRPGALELV